MTSAAAAAPVRVGAIAFAFVSLLAVLVVGRADGSTRASSVYLAPDNACASASDPNAPAAVQTRAIVCLVNYARAQDRRRRLVQRPRLHLAAELKGERVATCRQFSHTPCGAALTSDVQAAGYRYSTFGENLFAGTWGHYSARDVVNAWLNSPPHRANMLNGRFRDLGAAPVRATGLLDGGDAVVWTATFGTRRSG
ncbi:MAG TPA: CAP domain-containing protein [Gaiellaceae bacterium]|nr:CAP domain-containing protein [Gaiellaceae bacterium]